MNVVESSTAEAEVRSGTLVSAILETITVGSPSEDPTKDSLYQQVAWDHSPSQPSQDAQPRSMVPGEMFLQPPLSSDSGSTHARLSP